jgi:hypothetical protein
MKKLFFALIVLLYVYSPIYSQESATASSVRTEVKSNYSNNNNIEVTVVVEKELFPVIAKTLSEGNIQSREDEKPIRGLYYDPNLKQIVIPSGTNNNFSLPDLVKWNIHNKNNYAINISVSSEIPEWTQPTISTVEIEANESKQISQTPFGINLLSNKKIVPATVLLSAKVNNIVIHEETKNVNVRPADDMIWSLHTSYDTKYLVAAWVTPKDEMVESILSIAKDKMFNHSLAGYNGNNLMSEIKAIFNAVRNSKVSYVDSHMSFGQVGFTQRVRLPKESILQRSANCIDGTVLFASLFENIGLEPLIILVPGHAFVGVRLAPNSQQTLFIETTLVGRNMLNSILTLKTTFDAAVEEGLTRYNNEMSRNPNEVHIIDIKEARTNGIYPLW